MTKEEAKKSIEEKTFEFLDGIKEEATALKAGRQYQNIATVISRSFPHMTPTIQKIVTGKDYKEDPKEEARTPEKVTSNMTQKKDPCQDCPPSNAITSDSHKNPLSNIIPKITRAKDIEPVDKAPEVSDKEVNYKLLYSTGEVLGVAQLQANSKLLDVRNVLIMIHELVTGKKPHHLAKNETIAEKVAEYNKEGKGRTNLSV